MQTNQAQTRDEIEDEIERCKETIAEHVYALRWFTRGYRTFWAATVTTAICIGLLSSFNIPILQPLLVTVGVVAGIIALVVGIITASASEGRSIRDPRKELREAKRTLEKLLRRLAVFDERAIRDLTPEQYKHQLPVLIAAYRRQADRYRRQFVVTQIITILLSAAITSLSGGWLDKYISLPWVIPVFSALISILTSFTLFFKFREKGTNLQQTADAMDWEHMTCTLGIGRYAGMAKADRLPLLADRAEALRKEQQQRQLQLEQSSHAEQKALQPNA